MDTLTFVIYVLFGSLGMGYFVYGRRQKMVVPLISGIGLMIYPYFFSNAVWLVVVGCILLGVPFFVKY